MNFFEEPIDWDRISVLSSDCRDIPNDFSEETKIDIEKITIQKIITELKRFFK